MHDFAFLTENYFLTQIFFVRKIVLTKNAILFQWKISHSNIFFKQNFLLKYFGPHVYLTGSYVVTLVCPSVLGLSLNISETSDYFFLKFCIRLGVNKIKNVAQPKFWKKILIHGLRGFKCQKFVFFDIFAETAQLKFLIFCMMVEGNKGHHLSLMPY